MQVSLTFTMSPFSNYDQAIEWLYDLHLFGIKFGLKKIEKLLEYLDNPQNKLKIIHVGGTNGKGSVCAILGSILINAGFKVGVNTSPHLSEFTERIQINGEQISKDKVVKYANLLEEIRERINSETKYGYATYFEVVTAMALKYFADNNVDYVILEVGLGGTYDATNIVTPVITVLTSIALDHTEHLGNTLTSIAENKAGIIKTNSPVLTSNTSPEVLDVIIKTCKSQKSECYQIGKDISTKLLESNLNGVKFNYSGLNFDFSELHVPLLGVHQMENASLAVGVLDILRTQKEVNISEQTIRDGLEKTYWPGRLEIIQKSPLVLLDGAHNPAGAKALRESLKSFEYKDLYLVFGCSEEKNIKNLVSELIPLAKKIFITQANIRRAATPDLILKQIEDYNLEKAVVLPVKSAVNIAQEQADNDDLICICGSLFIVGEARELWTKGKDNNSIETVHRIHY